MNDLRKILDEATPGPWRADGEPWNRIVWSSADNRVCFMAHNNGLDDERDIATSNLIALAPDLAAALLKAEEALREYDTRLRHCSANIVDEYPMWSGDLRKMADTARAALSEISKLTGGPDARP